MFAPPRSAQVAKTTSVPAPIGGLNARDSLAAMPETDALAMVNWWPQPYGVSVRKGYKLWASGLAGVVETLFTYAATSGLLRTFAWAGPSLFDIYSPGPVAGPTITGLSNAEWSAINVVNVAGSFMLAVNGVDDGIVYNGAAFDRISAGTTPIQFSTWTGLDPKDAVQLTVHQHRIWAVEKGTTVGWYTAPDAIEGAFTAFDFGPLFSRGGFLSFLTTWTIDDGNGAEDHLVAVSSSGDAVVFGGTNPNDDTAWSLVGVYFVGAPVAGRRSFTKAGGDLLFLTQQGVVSMASLLVSTRVNEAENPITSKKVQFLVSEAIAKYADLPGWAIRYYPRHNMVIVNVPSSNNPATTQLAANQITGSWTTFYNMPAASWGIFDTGPIFGDYDGNVWKAWEGYTDAADVDGLNGTGIIARVQQAYSYMGVLGQQKHVAMYRPVLLTGAPITMNTVIQYDFRDQQVNVPTAAPMPSTADRWDEGKWDTATWSGASSIQKTWAQGEGVGIAASLKMVTQSDTDVLWVSTDYVTKMGGIL